MQDERHVFSQAPQWTQLDPSMTGRKRLKRLIAPSSVPTGQNVWQYARP